MGESRKAGGAGMKVYHGGTVVVKEPLAGIGRAGLDFADDRVVDTVESYIAGLMGVEEALKRLTFLVPNNQICLLNQRLIDRCLRFVNFTRI